MVITEKSAKTLKFLIFSYIFLFPFGQLLNLNISVLGRLLIIRPVDLIAIITVPFVIFSKRIRIPTSLLWFLGYLIFGLITSLFKFPVGEVLVNSLYLLRVFGYVCMFFLTFDLIKTGSIKKENALSMLLVASLSTAIFGWIQYLYFPNLIDLKYVGWDDHLFRLVGTFLDPGFTALIIVFGAVISIILYFEKQKKIFLGAFSFLLISLLFTYSRAGYLSLLIAFLYLLKTYKKYLVILLSLALFFLAIFSLPRPASEGAELERTKSIFLRLDNYKETIEIIKENPVFGVGFNNVCSARVKKFSDNFSSHSCAGSDSSILFILATIGIVGVLMIIAGFKKTPPFQGGDELNPDMSSSLEETPRYQRGEDVINLARSFISSMKKDYYGQILKACLTAVVIHSLFANSLFYPFVMGFLVILAGVALKE